VIDKTPTQRGIPLRALAPNVVTAMALCAGLTSVRFGIAHEWQMAVIATLVAAMLDGIDGRVARLFRAESRFGAELDSLSDVVAFGVAPSLVLFLWSLQSVPKIGWLIAIGFSLSAALRLARFNANIDVEDQPHKSAGFMTGVPAPAGAALALLPLYLWIETKYALFRDPIIVGPWLGAVALLMISNLATFSWGSIRPRRTVRLELIFVAAMVGSALFTNPWITLSAISLLYVGTLPFSIRSYAKVRRLRAG
jgi:CDP-diacylglycerol---serine O-phosphatidyltransferase